MEIKTNNVKIEMKCEINEVKITIERMSKRQREANEQWGQRVAVLESQVASMSTPGDGALGEEIQLGKDPVVGHQEKGKMSLPQRRLRKNEV